MSKTFDVMRAQQRALSWHKMFVGRAFRHYKGDVYTVVDISVFEGTGAVHVEYVSTTKFVVPGKPFKWSRTLEEFTGLTDEGIQRFRALENE